MICPRCRRPVADHPGGDACPIVLKVGVNFFPQLTGEGWRRLFEQRRAERERLYRLFGLEAPR